MDIETTIQSFLVTYGLLTVFVIVALEYANVPLPSEIVLPLIGMFVAQGTFSFEAALITSIIGGLIGSWSNYYLGYFLGERSLSLFIKWFPKSKRSIDYSVHWFQRYDKIGVLASRFVPLARTFISIPAGIVKMNLFTFSFLTVIGVSIWNAILIGAGIMLGENFEEIKTFLMDYYIVVAVVLIIGVVFFIVKKRFIRI